MNKKELYTITSRFYIHNCALQVEEEPYGFLIIMTKKIDDAMSSTDFRQLTSNEVHYMSEDDLLTIIENMHDELDKKVY